MARAFITGVNGFIGSHLAEELLERGCEVTGLVRPSSDTRSLVEAFRRYGPKFRLVLGDIRDKDSLEAGIADADYVFHLAAVLMGTREADFRDTNATGTCNVLEEALKRHRQCSLKRVIITSSIAVAGPSPNADPIGVSHPEQPISWYGESKLRAEESADWYMAEGLPITIARPVLVYGGRDRDFSGGVFPMISCGIAPRIGFKRKEFSLIHVDELVEGMIAAANSAAADGETYFFSDPKVHRDTQVVTAIADAMKKACRIPIWVPHWVMKLLACFCELKNIFDGKRPVLTRDKVREVRNQWWAASPAKALADFGWQSTTSLDEGMVEAVAAWRSRRAASPAGPERLRDRILKTLLLALVVGIAIEGLAKIGGWWKFDPGWVVLLIVILGFGGVLGGVSLLTASKRKLVQFLAGGFLGFVGEFANAMWLERWSFSQEFVGWLPQNDWIISLAVGLPLGFVPVIINFVVDGLYCRRCRLGCGPVESGV